MDIKEIINKKALNKKLTQGEIEYFIKGYCSGEITDYQASALLMAIKINGMTEKETFDLTHAMLNSGEIINLEELGFCVDKHSTGGVSDTTTLALIPICACLGVKMLKISGRSLGFTGGTADKMESFDGFNAELDIEMAKKLVAKNGACIITSSPSISPADKKLYALRDATATTESIPLIASSIMSKKLASGANAIVLDVKYGNGAFMKTKKDAKELASLMVKIGKVFGKKMDYILSDMNEPLGNNVGCKLEAYEAIELLSGKVGKLRDLTLTLASKCVAFGLNISESDALKMATQALDSGIALEKFKQIVKAQGGSLKLFKGLGLKPKCQVYSNQHGTLGKINCEKLGLLVGELGASRNKLGNSIDYNVGITTFHKIGDKVNVGDLLFNVYAEDKQTANSYTQQLINCYLLEQSN